MWTKAGKVKPVDLKYHLYMEYMQLGGSFDAVQFKNRILYHEDREAEEREPKQRARRTKNGKKKELNC